MLNLQQFPSQQKGVGLIEVLVTALVLAVGLMGMAVLQLRSTQFNQSAYIKSQANILAYDIADRMRTNRTVFYTIGRTQTAPTGTSLIAIDLTQWKTQLASSLPAGQGSITCNATNNCTITIFWREPSQDGDMTLTYTTRI